MSQVRVLATHQCIVALGKLLTTVCLCQSIRIDSAEQIESNFRQVQFVCPSAKQVPAVLAFWLQNWMITSQNWMIMSHCNLELIPVKSINKSENTVLHKRGIHRHQTPSRSRNAGGCATLCNTRRIVIRPIMAKRDAIHKTGSTQHIAVPPEKDQEICSQTDGQTDGLITILHTPTWA